MIKGVRRPEEVAGLGLGNRLLIRIGALLKKKVAISLPLLESARPNTPLEAILLDPKVLEAGANIDAELLKNIAAERPENKDLIFATSNADDGFRVICLQEELDAGEGWGATETAASSELAAVPSQKLEPQSGAGKGHEHLFPRAELERWRLKMVTAAAAEERLEGLRTLMLAPLSNTEKLDVILVGISDRDASVRAEAASQMASLGASRDVADALSSLNNKDAARRQAAIERLLKILDGSGSSKLTDLELGSVAVCAISMLRHEFDTALTAQLLLTLQKCAPELARNPERVAEVMRIVVVLVETAAKNRAPQHELDQLLAPAQRLAGALGKAAPRTLLTALQAEMERCADLVTEAFVLQAMLDLRELSAEEDARLCRRAAEYIGRDTDEGRNSRAIGTRLVRRGEKALVAICDSFANAHPGAQRYFLVLFDDIYRTSKISNEHLEKAASVALHAIQTASKGVRMAAMECRFFCDAEVGEETRRKLTKEFLDSIGDFLFRSDIEKIETTIARMGLAAVEPLLERAAPERPRDERIRAVRLLGNWSLNVKAPRGQIARLQQSVTEVLRKLQALSLDEKFPDRGELLCALGKLVSSPAASRDADAVITRTLLDAAKGNDAQVVPFALEGLSYIASSRRAAPDLIHATSELLRHTLEGLVMDIGTREKRVNGETVIEITGGEKYTNLLPIILKGMSRVGCSSSCPPAITKDLGAVLLARWKKILNGELVWGPANSALLIDALKEMACNKNFPSELRLEVLRSFAPRHVQTSIMHSLTEILAADDTTDTAIGALTIGHAILGRRSKEGQFSLEDREDILKALTRIVGRKLLGGISSEAQQKSLGFRRIVVDELFKGLKDFVPGSFESLVVLREGANMPKDIRDDIERRLKDYQSIVLV